MELPARPFEPHSYFTIVIAADLQRRPSNMNVILVQVISDLMTYTSVKITGIGFVTPNPGIKSQRINSRDVGLIARNYACLARSSSSSIFLWVITMSPCYIFCKHVERLMISNPWHCYFIINLLYQYCVTGIVYNASWYANFLQTQCSFRIPLMLFSMDSCKLYGHKLGIIDMQPTVELCHYDDIIMAPMASQITSLTVVYSIVYSDADQRKHQNSASLAFVWGIHRGPVNSSHKWPVTRKMFPFDDVIMSVRLVCSFNANRVAMYFIL